MLKFLTGWLLDSNDRVVRKMRPLVDAIEAAEARLAAVPSEQWPAETEKLKLRLANGETLDDVLPEAFALVRLAATKVLGQSHYPVQLMGGIVLHRGQIAEMRTGEGKTLTSTLPVYLNALAGKGVHVITVNDYLAKRDASWMGRVFAALGLATSVIQDSGSFMFDDSADANDDGSQGVKVAREYLKPCAKKEAYAADITYGTNSEFGFDYLRDNMAVDKSQLVQRPLSYAVIDEVDSILIDEARTPLIISGATENATERYYQFAGIARDLEAGTDYAVDEKFRNVAMTDAGVEKIERLLGVENFYAPQNIALISHLEKALKAEALFKRDKDYVVQEGEVKIVDEFTGRIMQGRRYSEGIHQAIEAKENVSIQQESQTMATITIQNYFRQYEKLSGMTGTAVTEAEEFSKIYKLDVVAVPPHRESLRRDLSDRVYVSTDAKLQAVTETVREAFDRGQPVLIGTVSIAKSEQVSAALSKAGIPHNVLNAKAHEREGEVIAQAGKLKAVTVATNMAGRGVDILLGGNPVDPEAQRQVRELGGLMVIGTERHESRRIDNQLRGRAGRQGDPGITQFYCSLDDDLLRVFGSERIKSLVQRLGLPPEVPIENGMVTSSLANAQKKVEGFHFDSRKHVVEFDDVLNKQREVIYRRRHEALLAERPAEGISVLGEKSLALLDEYLGAGEAEYAAGAEAGDVLAELSLINDLPEGFAERLRAAAGDGEEIANAFSALRDAWHAAYAAQAEEAERVAPEYGFVAFERALWLRTIDQFWVEHMGAIDNVRAGIQLRGYAQKEPLVEYQHEAYRLFKELLQKINEHVVQLMFKLTPRANEKPVIESRPAALSYTDPTAELRDDGASELAKLMGAATIAEGSNRSQRRKKK